MLQRESPIIAVDFDGTIVKHDYPRIGEEVPGAIDTLLFLQREGCRLILYTMRSGSPLDEAIEFCRSRGVEFWCVNRNPDQDKWTDSPKVYAHHYIDDAAVGCPLVYPPDGSRPYVNWPAASRAAIPVNHTKPFA